MPDEAIGVFVQPALPRIVRPRKVGVCLAHVFSPVFSDRDLADFMEQTGQRDLNCRVPREPNASAEAF